MALHLEELNAVYIIMTEGLINLLTVLLGGEKAPTVRIKKTVKIYSPRYNHSCKYWQSTDSRTCFDSMGYKDFDLL